MQNYLLSHVLFDGNEMKKKEKKEKVTKEDDDIDKFLDQEYKDKINQYCYLLEEDKQQQKRKKKKKKKVEEKKEEKVPVMKMVEIKSIQQQLFQQQQQGLCHKRHRAPDHPQPLEVIDSNISEANK